MGGLSLTTAPHILPVKFRGEKRGPRGDKGTLLARGGPEALSKTRERERWSHKGQQGLGGLSANDESR